MVGHKKTHRQGQKYRQRKRVEKRENIEIKKGRNISKDKEKKDTHETLQKEERIDGGGKRRKEEKGHR